MASGVYNRFKYDAMVGNLALNASDTINIQLHTSTYTPNADHNVIGDLTNEVAAGGGYSTGGAALSTPTITQDDTNDVAYLDGVNTTWSTSTITARYAVVVDVTNTNSLICWIDFGSDKSSSGGDFTIQWDTTGIVEIA